MSELSEFRIDGKVAIVTGAGTGNGRSIALQLARQGAKVFVNDVRREAAEAVVAEATAAGADASALVADVSDPAAWASKVKQAAAEAEHLDVLVNNAGIIRAADLETVTEESWDVTFAVNLRGLFFSMQTAARIMMDQQSGVIINLSSIGARTVPTLSPPYAASKAGVISVTQQAAYFLAPHGVRVNAICPGVIMTDFNRRLDDELGSARGLASGEFISKMAESIPLGRLGEPEDVAYLAGFLASPAAGFITGQSINVDGGRVSS